MFRLQAGAVISMGYKVLADSPALYEFADEKTRLSVFDALVLRGKKTNYNFESALNIQKQEGLSNKTAYVDGKPVECLEVGGKYFISERVKCIFDKHEVDAEYFEAKIKINGELFNENYYLFNPQVGIDCLDYKKSKYLKEFDDWSNLYNISDISPLVIHEELIHADLALFFLGNIFGVEKNGIRFLAHIVIVSDALAKDLFKANLRGLNIFDIEKYRYDWKWKDN